MSARPDRDASRLAQLRAEAAGCRACELWKRGTQTVFGEGPPDARLMLIGEQPANEEDLTGRPFVGAAGRLLDRALAGAGLDRASVYVTNVVKHFKWEERGKRRIHKKPSLAEIAACRPWLEAEIAAVRPDVIVCLGATAAQALLGGAFRVTTERGRFVPSTYAARVLATVHPSAILRAPDDRARHEETARFTDDLRVAARALESAPAGPRPAAPGD